MLSLNAEHSNYAVSSAQHKFKYRSASSTDSQSLPPPTSSPTQQKQSPLCPTAWLQVSLVAFEAPQSLKNQFSLPDRNRSLTLTPCYRQLRDSSKSSSRSQLKELNALFLNPSFPFSFCCKPLYSQQHAVFESSTMQHHHRRSFSNVHNPPILQEDALASL